MEQAKKFDLEEFVAKLESIKGRHTELVSVYVPAGYNLNNVVNQLESEKSTASNIKSKSTRTCVMDSLERIIRHLKNIGRTPANGIAVFAGNVSDTDQINIEMWSIEPPEPMKVRMYRCDKDFVIEPLKEMLSAKEVYGLLVIDRKEATIGILEGKKVKMLEHLTSGIPGKMKAGGQSSNRFRRLTEGIAKEFYRRVADSMKSLFFEDKRLKGIIIGGPLPTKEDFMKEGELVTALKEKVIGLKDLGDAGEPGLNNLVEMSSDLLAKQEIIKEKNLLTKFFNTLGKNPKKARYGLEPVKAAMNLGAVELLLVSKKLDKEVIKELIKLADDFGTAVEYISEDTPEGEQFFNLSGIGALLRYEI